MANLPTTRTSLLEGLRDHGNAESWGEFAQVYGPIIYAYGRRRGLQDADAEDLRQSVLQAVADVMGRLAYDRGRGPFRAWLFTVARNKLYDLRARLRAQPRGTGDTAARQELENVQAADADEDLWRQEYEKRLFDWAGEQARGGFQETTWRAFLMTAVEGRSGQEVAAALGMTVAAVYLAKSRVVARLRELIEQLGEE
jgi:RNA polymerase sigma-70 factor (ECF subfamily)